MNGCQGSTRCFNNLRLRCDGLITGFADVGSLAASAIDQAAMNRFLGQLDRILNVALPKGFAISIAWQHNSAEGRISVQDGNNYVEWWRQVATHTAARNYMLSYNLMLEIGQQPFGSMPHNGLYDFPNVYNDWTRRAISAIRSVNMPGSHNADRIIIATAPQNTQTESLNSIAADVLADDNLMIEYHAYAAGAQSTGHNEWHGNGSPEDRARLTNRIDAIQNFAATHGIPMYWGAWMPMDNRTSTLSQSEVDNFAEFFSYELAAEGIPWSLNKLENSYDTATLDWKQTEPFPNNLIIDVDQALNRSILGHGLGLAAGGVPLAENPVLQNQYRDQILSEVNQIADFGTESIVSVYGSHAMSVLTDSEQRTAVAAAELPSLARHYIERRSSDDNLSTERPRSSRSYSRGLR